MSDVETKLEEAVGCYLLGLIASVLLNAVLLTVIICRWLYL